MQQILYANSVIDRDHLRRKRATPLSALEDLESLRLLVIWKQWVLVHTDAASPPWLQGDRAASLVRDMGEALYLGKMDGLSVYVVDASALEGGDSGPVLAPNTRFADLRLLAAQLPSAIASLLAYARGVVLWRRNHRHCGLCGAPTKPEEGGHVLRCSDGACNHLIYPRTDPAVIMLVYQADKILLHRQSVWPAGMWSCMAGFVEPGETLENAVRREVREESGIEVDDVIYMHSQPWPFPSSLMIAFTAQAVGGTLKPDLAEIEDARWFSVQDLEAFDDAHRQQGSGLFLSTPGSAARILIEGWRRRHA